MDEATLIEEVKVRDAIWNKDNKMYKNNTFKGKEWEQIAKNMRETKNECMKTWKKLLTKYKKEREIVKKSRTSGCGLEDAYYSPWPFYENMEFLNTSIDSAETSGNLDESLFVIDANKTAVQRNESLNHDCSLPSTSKEENSNTREGHDMLYFRNLLPYTLQVPAKNKLKLQTEMNELIFKYAYPSENWQNHPRPLGMQNQPGPSGMQSQPGPSGMQSQPGPSGMQSKPGPLGMQSQPGPSGMQSRPGPSGMQSRPGTSEMQCSQKKNKHKHVQVKKEIDSDSDIEYIDTIVLPVERSSAETVVKKETKEKTESGASSDIAAAAAAAAAGAYAAAGWSSFLQTVGVPLNSTNALPRPTTSSLIVNEVESVRNPLNTATAKRIKTKKNCIKEEKSKQHLLTLNGIGEVIEISDDEDCEATNTHRTATTEKRIKIEKDANKEEKYKPHLLSLNGADIIIDISDDEDYEQTQSTNDSENVYEQTQSTNDSKNVCEQTQSTNDSINVCEKTQSTNDTKNVGSKNDNQDVDLSNDKTPK